jgi:mannose-1-phosphate guanylyltransferase/mannose-6-phosphate isomerase
MTYAVILAGGVGSRFWPFSRELEPKQFMKIVGEDSLLQSTVKRLNGLVYPKNTYIVTNNIYYYKVKSQISRFRIPDKNIILEPSGKNTAPAIALCAKLINSIDKEAVLLILPSDHYIKNVEKFKKTIKEAILCAKEDFLVTIGIKPGDPSTGYGYVKVGDIGKGIGRGKGYFKVDKFLEKPNLKEAERYVKNRNFFWNSGMFVWKVGVLLEEVKKYLPKLYAKIMQINRVEDIPGVWPDIDPISIDYGIMERSRRIALIPASFYWTDLGSWDALGEIFYKDAKGNILNGDTLDLKSQGTCVFNRGNRLICTVGAKDLIIADTPDALLVCNKDNTQDIKKVVEVLKLSKRKERLTHLTERRPWGLFTVLQSGLGFKIKLIEINSGKRLSLQRHNKRAEHWVVVSGVAKVTSGNKVRLVRSNESIYIPKGIKHRLENPGRIPLKIVEVQTGAYLEEDDIERLDDDFKKECRS